MQCVKFLSIYNCLVLNIDYHNLTSQNTTCLYPMLQRSTTLMTFESRVLFIDKFFEYKERRSCLYFETQCMESYKRIKDA